MVLLVLEDSALSWGLLPAVLALVTISFLRVDHVATEELVHLAVAVQASRCARFACFREDEDFVWHRVKQIFELVLLKCDNLYLHKQVRLGLVVHVDNGLHAAK